METQDGSPSLQWLAHDRREIMHHSGGAFSETIYIYEPVVKAAFQRFESPTLVSVGLGLGYNEILVAKHAADRTCQLVSFESDSNLRSAFRAFVSGESSPLTEVYRKICRFFEVDERQIREWFQRQKWQCEPALQVAAQMPPAVHGFLWDAFSKNTTPELWEEKFLIECFSRGVAGATLGTYASHSVLKRSLKASGFAVEIRDGFQGKRNSTFASLENGDFYLEDGRMVFTARYHLERGYCCDSGCRHCPY